jgi:hypothetical protein
LRWSLLVCAFVSTTLAAEFAQSIAVEVASAEAAHDAQTGKPVVVYRMSAASARAFFDPLILAAMGPDSQISGDFGIEKARSITRRLSDGTAKLTIGIASDGGRGR